MTRLYRYFFRGLITVLPIALTLYLLLVFLTWTERAALSLLSPFIGSFYVPGMGLLLGILGILLIGYLVSKERVQKIFHFVEMPFTNTPVIKSIYSSLKSFADYFSPSAKADTQHVVVLRIPGQALELVGLITRRGTEGLPDGFLSGDRVAVYLPMGYMIGGYTVFVPTDWVQPIDMSVEEAMRASLIAWMAQSSASGRPVPPTAPVPPTGPASRAPSASPVTPASPASPATPVTPASPVTSATPAAPATPTAPRPASESETPPAAPATTQSPTPPSDVPKS